MTAARHGAVQAGRDFAMPHTELQVLRERIAAAESEIDILRSEREFCEAEVRECVEALTLALSVVNQLVSRIKRLEEGARP